MSDDSIEYFVYCDDEIQGPLTRSQIKRLLRKGGINGETLCAIDGGSQWAPVSTLFSSQKSTKSPSSTIEKPGEGRVAYGAAISMFCGFLGVLCLGGVVLKQSWGFWFVAAAALLALASGVFTIMQGRNREPGPHILLWPLAVAPPAVLPLWRGRGCLPPCMPAHQRLRMRKRKKPQRPCRTPLTLKCPQPCCRAETRPAVVLST